VRTTPAVTGRSTTSQPPLGFSLFRRFNSLIHRKNSLIYYVGNSVKRPRYCRALLTIIQPQNARFRENSLLIPCLSGNLLQRMVRY